jgi:hypothetical protein
VPWKIPASQGANRGHVYGTVEPEILCCIHKLQKTWDGKHELVEEENPEFLEARGGDPRNECFQVSANTIKPETVKVRKCDGRDGRRMHELPLYLAVGNREFKEYYECFQLRHEGNPLEQSIWVEVRGWVDHDKTECDEAHGGRE